MLAPADVARVRTGMPTMPLAGFIDVHRGHGGLFGLTLTRNVDGSLSMDCAPCGQRWRAPRALVKATRAVDACVGEVTTDP